MCDAQAVLNLVALELEAPAVDVAEVDAAVGHHAVDVERDELDRSGERGVDHRRYPIPDVDGPLHERHRADRAESCSARRSARCRGRDAFP